MLTTRGLGKSFGGKTVLRDVNVDIAPGTITCVIGPSGTGKTTLLRALSLLDLPDSGVISLDGQDYSFPLQQGAAITPAPWPKLTAVFQSLFLWPHLTLRENILLPARNIDAAKAEKDIEGLIAFFEMQGFIDSYPNQASIGQRQRVAMARALILNPRYLLLDEITSALDVEQTVKILTKLGHLKERNIGVFLITHQIGFARKSADQIVFMDGGTVAERGGPDILDAPKTARLQQFLSAVHEVY
ncbi:MAG: ATP-binding cassette domain-containing protein [Alphaproteobacteria bacterium]|nr:ATP-binding cassette domain-containing protein [Alphaproteobacteria bacterium]